MPKALETVAFLQLAANRHDNIIALSSSARRDALQHGPGFGTVNYRSQDQPRRPKDPSSKGVLVILIGLLLMVPPCIQASPAQGAPPISLPAAAGAPPSTDVEGEVARLRAALISEVPGLIIDTPADEWGWIARSRAAMAESGQTIDHPQLLVVIDRNPVVQQMRIVLARTGGPWESLGGSKVSTGQRGRRDYYVTPTGVFLHTDAILDWRAEGTFNENHIRGLGLKGMRVWDFGGQRATRGWGRGGERRDIRLLLHATDPTYLEQRLGRPASKGCVRIPAAMNRFLDRHGVLDADYERVATVDNRFQAVLLPSRTPTPLAGDALVIVDSSEAGLDGTFNRMVRGGVVTLPTEEREGLAALEISSSRDHLAPYDHRRGAEGAVRWSRGEVALDVESVVDGGVSGEKSLG